MKPDENKRFEIPFSSGGIFFDLFTLKVLLPSSDFVFFAVCFSVFLAPVFFAGSARHEPLHNPAKVPSLQQIFSS
jgi:hypothetical protein